MLSTALDDIGVNMHTVHMRRRLARVLEMVFNIGAETLGDVKMKSFIVGSHSEGTTTLDLNSDLDVLYCRHDNNVILKWDDWKYGSENLRMFKLPTTAPQQYLIQLLYADTPEPVYSHDLKNIPENITNHFFLLQSDCLTLRTDVHTFVNRKFLSGISSLETVLNGPAITV